MDNHIRTARAMGALGRTQATRSGATPAPAAGGSEDNAAQQRNWAASPWAVLAIILTAVFMQLLDTTITMVGVPSIQGSLHSSFGEIQLVVAGYMLAFACVLVTGGNLGNTYGRKRMFLWGMAGFTIASAVCGAAPNALTLIIARVIQGMCSGLMFPQVLSIIQVVFGKEQRTKAIGLYGATIGLATILGPAPPTPNLAGPALTRGGIRKLILTATQQARDFRKRAGPQPVGAVGAECLAVLGAGGSFRSFSRG